MECKKCGETKPITEYEIIGKYTRKQCMDCFKIIRKNYSAKYYKLHKEDCSKYYKNWYEKNKDRQSDYQSNYYQTNKDKVSERNRKYYENNKDKILQRQTIETDLITF